MALFKRQDAQQQKRQYSKQAPVFSPDSVALSGIPAAVVAGVHVDIMYAVAEGAALVCRACMYLFLSFPPSASSSSSVVWRGACIEGIGSTRRKPLDSPQVRSRARSPKAARGRTSCASHRRAAASGGDRCVPIDGRPPELELEALVLFFHCTHYLRPLLSLYPNFTRPTQVSKHLYFYPIHLTEPSCLRPVYALCPSIHVNTHVTIFCSTLRCRQP